jgi:hypothetical protein
MRLRCIVAVVGLGVVAAGGCKKPPSASENPGSQAAQAVPKPTPKTAPPARVPVQHTSERPSGTETTKWTKAAQTCPELCRRILACKLGPFDSEDECASACESAEDDPVTLRAYSCRYEAKSCREMAACK